MCSLNISRDACSPMHIFSGYLYFTLRCPIFVIRCNGATQLEELHLTSVLFTHRKLSMASMYFFLLIKPQIHLKIGDICL